MAAKSGVSFRFDAGSRGKHDLPEIMGGGVAIFDADGDGHLDLYLANGGPIVSESGRDDPPGRLYRNKGDGRFDDITAKAGCPGPSYAMGVAVGDVDGDGRDDLFVSGWRDQRLYRNLGGGRFADVTEASGLISDRWSTSAAFADLDGDGDLDLYVASYVDYDPKSAPFCAAPDGRRDFCGPEEFLAQPHRLYRNDGGRFIDVAKPAGIASAEGRGLGVVAADLTGDGRVDLFVANDGSPCWLFANRGGLRFEEVGVASSLALDGDGNALAGMGVAANDVDGDGRLDLAVGNFLGRSTILFRGLGGGLYRDESASRGLSALTRTVLGFGITLEDFDGDGAPDLLQANGHVLDRARLGQPLAMKTTLARNIDGKFADAARQADPWFDRPIVGRGLAVGDMDGDGRPDAVINAIDSPAALLRNESAAKFVTVELVGKPPSHPSAIGAVVRARIGDKTIVRHVIGGGSYLSASSRRVHLGLGTAEEVETLEVSWPSGRTEVWKNLRPGRLARIVEGTAVRSGAR